VVPLSGILLQLGSDGGGDGALSNAALGIVSNDE
jgi:hypothetical protein